MQDQNFIQQKDALPQIGCQQIFTDNVNGGKSSRTGLDDAFDFLREEDTLIVWKSASKTMN
ncbi:recombinase family protein [Robertmurraya sp. P23]|uniref:recombinase family protein n=1 Tax=Robertmurraya sp. P23 TaxID=3436931 RepID=UPI003D986212